MNDDQRHLDYINTINRLETSPLPESNTTPSIQETMGKYKQDQLDIKKRLEEDPDFAKAYNNEMKRLHEEAYDKYQKDDFATLGRWLEDQAIDRAKGLGAFAAGAIGGAHKIATGTEALVTKGLSAATGAIGLDQVSAALDDRTNSNRERNNELSGAIKDMFPKHPNQRFAGDMVGQTAAVVLGTKGVGALAGMFRAAPAVVEGAAPAIKVAKPLLTRVGQSSAQGGVIGTIMGAGAPAESNSEQNTNTLVTGVVGVAAGGLSEPLMDLGKASVMKVAQVFGNFMDRVALPSSSVAARVGVDAKAMSSKPFDSANPELMLPQDAARKMQPGETASTGNMLEIIGKNSPKARQRVRGWVSEKAHTFYEKFKTIPISDDVMQPLVKEFDGVFESEMQVYAQNATSADKTSALIYKNTPKNSVAYYQGLLHNIQGRIKTTEDPNLKEALIKLAPKLSNMISEAAPDFKAANALWQMRSKLDDNMFLNAPDSRDAINLIKPNAVKELGPKTWLNMVRNDLEDFMSKKPDSIGLIGEGQASAKGMNTWLKVEANFQHLRGLVDGVNPNAVAKLDAFRSLAIAQRSADAAKNTVLSEVPAIGWLNKIDNPKFNEQFADYLFNDKSVSPRLQKLINEGGETAKTATIVAITNFLNGKKE